MKLTTKLTLKKYQTPIITAVIVAAVLAGFAWSARPTKTNLPPTPEGMDEATHQSHHPEESAASAQEASTLAFEPSTFDFGKISMAKGKVSQNVKVRNTSAAPVTLKKIFTSCMCTTGALDVNGKKLGPYGMPGHGPIPTFSETLAPGQDAELEIVFNPNAHGPAGVGPVRREVYLETDSGRAKVQFNGYVTP